MPHMKPLRFDTVPADIQERFRHYQEYPGLHAEQHPDHGAPARHRAGIHGTQPGSCFMRVRVA